MSKQDKNGKKQRLTKQELFKEYDGILNNQVQKEYLGEFNKEYFKSNKLDVDKKNKNKESNLKSNKEIDTFLNLMKEKNKHFEKMKADLQSLNKQIEEVRKEKNEEEFSSIVNFVKNKKKGSFKKGPKVKKSMNKCFEENTFEKK